MQDDARPGPGGFVILGQGFRPFFLLAGIYGVVSPVIWLIAYSGGGDLPGALPGVAWHGHEMVFGFVTAAAAGFLLTAAPNWAGAAPVSGRRLGVLVVLWLLGRFAFWMAGWIPPVWVAVADLSLIPALMVVQGQLMIPAGDRRNYFFLGLLAVLVVANGFVHAEALGLSDDAALTGLKLAVYTFVLLLAIISGRVVPNFTANALRARKDDTPVLSSPAAEKLALAAVIAAAAGDLAGLEDALKGGLALFAAAALVFRARNWRFLKTLDQPMVWVLHLGHAWLAIGFAALGLAGLGGVISELTALHAFTMGAFGTMILAMMTRAALGHTGRDFVAGPAITAAYILVSGAASVRVFVPALGVGEYEVTVLASGLMWLTAYAIFTIVYWPILTGPRADGKPG